MMSEAILEAELVLKEAKENLRSTRLRVQKSCAHPLGAVVETTYVESNYVRCTSPFRVCKLCGYAEEGWGCGYWKLCPGVYDRYIISTVPKAEARTFVSGGVLRQDQLSSVRYNHKPHDTLWELLSY